MTHFCKQKGMWRVWIVLFMLSTQTVSLLQLYFQWIICILLVPELQATHYWQRGKNTQQYLGEQKDATAMTHWQQCKELQENTNKTACCLPSVGFQSVPCSSAFLSENLSCCNNFECMFLTRNLWLAKRYQNSCQCKRKLEWSGASSILTLLTTPTYSYLMFNYIAINFSEGNFAIFVQYLLVHIWKLWVQYNQTVKYFSNDDLLKYPLKICSELIAVMTFFQIPNMTSVLEQTMGFRKGRCVLGIAFMN